MNMIKYFIGILPVLIIFFSCSDSPEQKIEDKITIKNQAQKTDTTQTIFTVSGAKKPSIENGENIEYYESGVIKIRGMMKDGQRDGIWKSWYEDGTPWSETTFMEGKKNGKTTTWYENGKKRYDGFYHDDIESGKWMVWDEKGTLIETKNYDKK